MARKLVEYEDVAEAARHLMESGQCPSVIAIRNILGKGSFTTISSYLREWMDKDANNVAIEQSALPEQLVSTGQTFLIKLFNTAKAHADERLQQERNALAQKEGALLEEHQHVMTIADQAIDEAKRLSEELNTISSEKNELVEEVHKTKNLLSLKSAELDRSLIDLVKLEARIKELENKLEIKANDLIQAQDQANRSAQQNLLLNEKLNEIIGELNSEKDRSETISQELSSTLKLNESLRDKISEATVKVSHMESLIAVSKATAEASERERGLLISEIGKLEGVPGISPP